MRNECTIYGGVRMGILEERSDSRNGWQRAGSSAATRNLQCHHDRHPDSRPRVKALSRSAFRPSTRVRPMGVEAHLFARPPGHGRRHRHHALRSLPILIFTCHVPEEEACLPSKSLSRPQTCHTVLIAAAQPV